MMARSVGLPKDRLLVQIASYNTNLQGNRGLPQDLVDWLSPTLHVASFLTREPRAPDIVAVGFQELLPLHLGFSGLSKAVIESRNALILSQIEEHTPNKEKYSLVAKIVNVGVALLVYIKDDKFPRVHEVQTQWTGCGPAYMGNKGAVGVRFRLAAEDGSIGETFTFVCAHLTAHEQNLEKRISDYNHIVRTLLFDATPLSSSSSLTSMYSTSHLFAFGDLNFRLSLPRSHALYAKDKRAELLESLSSESGRESLKDFDQLYLEHKRGRVFLGFREGEFWNFKCSYKYNIGDVDKYSAKRVPSWTDRVLYTTYSDDISTPEQSNIQNLLYTTIPSYTTSDHKPIVALLLLPASTPSSPELPLIKLPSDFPLKPDPYATLKKYTGRTLDRIIGYVWWLLTLIGAGSSAFGLGNFILGMGMWTWWKRSNRTT